jgi:hypothetical protein
MSNPPPAIRAWAQQLLAAEATNQPSSGANGHEVMRVCENLRISLTPFVGADGFTVLLRRALALAQEDLPSLQNTRVTADGRLERIEKPPANARKEGEAALTITAHLLGLLVTFIGESLTLRLIRRVIPDAPNRIVEPEDS